MNDRVIPAEVYEPDESLPKDLRALRQFARLMDSAFTIPGTNRGIGLDPILGLVPGLGDVISAMFSSWMLLGALRHRVPPRKIMRMIFNISVDLLVGLIPLLGDVFDIFFTENLANVEIIIQHRRREREPRSYGSIALTFGLIFIAFGVLSAVVVIWLIVGLVRFSRSLG